MKLKKIGSKYGGWKIPTDALNEGAICYCFGAGEDISFDLELVEKHNCRVFVFDPTPLSILHIDQLKDHLANGKPMKINDQENHFYDISSEKLSSLFSFAPYGIYTRNELVKFFVPSDPSHVSHSITNLQQTDGYFLAECKTLLKIMSELDHDHIDLIKLDVEGVEHDVIENLMECNIYPRVLCVEFHHTKEVLAWETTLPLIRKLRKYGYALAHNDHYNFTFVLRIETPEASDFLKMCQLSWWAFRHSLRNKVA
jgi:FkbM family methyltransferase